MQSVRFWSHALLLVLASTLLAGCSKQPPECAETAASDALRNSMNAWIGEALPFKGVKPKEDRGGLIDKYLATWAFNLSNVTTTGYDEKSKTRSCAGKVSIAIPDKKQDATVDVQYEMQTLEDKKSGEFQLRTDGRYKTWSYGLIEPVADHYKVYRVSGTWIGKSNCGVTSIQENLFTKFADDEAAQGFTVLSTATPWVPDEAAREVPVKAVIDAGEVTLDVTAAGGKSIRRTSQLQPSQRFEIGAEDEMKTGLPQTGYISSDGMIYDSFSPTTAQARVKSNATGNELDGVLVRRCTLRLKKQ
jgi:hypothetical protein